MKPTDETVREIIAAHLELPPQAISNGQHLEKDLDLMPLDVVLVALKLEDEAQLQLSEEQLGQVETVDDLAHLFDNSI